MKLLYTAILLVSILGLVVSQSSDSGLCDGPLYSEYLKYMNRSS